MAMSPEQEALVGRVFDSYVTEHHLRDLQQLITDVNEETHRPVVVNAMTLFEANMEVGDFFNSFPNEVLLVFDAVLERKAMEMLNDSPHGCKGDEWRMRHSLHARMTGLPVCPELTRHTIPRSRDVGHFLSVTGTIIRTSIAKVLEFERDYLCSRCRYVFKLKADFDQFYTFTAPVSCPNPAGCNSFKFSCLSGGSEPAVCRDYQEIKIQEQVQRLSVGSIPRSLVVVLEDDLVDSCKSGDDVTVYGVMHLRWKPLYDGAHCDVELVLKANNVEVNNQQMADALLIKDVQKDFEEFWSNYEHDPIAGRNQILLSLCPQVFGMYVVKLAVAMVLAGGVQRVDPSGTKIRGECHLLLVGDPGTGKSQFLKYAAKIVSRSVLTAGIGSTSAGLTVAAVKDGGDWHLEAGALVLSDGGLCCIDEFSSIKEHDRISIHEAMEQQSISVAKAGMVCKLNTRTTILAATNPKGQYDSNEPLSVNVALASPLLSRFDLVLVLLDTRNADWDQIISTFILEDRGPPAESSSLWSMEKMRAYFSLVKHLQPQMSEQANCILTRYYQLQRQSDSRNAARTTIRMLESLSRLAEGHARLMFRETVTIEDAVMAVSVMECSMQGGALLGNVNTLLTCFPTDPVQQYQTQCRVLLAGLDLPLLLRQEIGRLSRMRTNMSQGTHRGSPSAGDQHHLNSPESINQTQDLHIALESINQTPNLDFQGCVAAERTLNWFPTISSTPATQHTTSSGTTPGQKVKENPNTSTLTESYGTEEDGLELHCDVSLPLEKERWAGKKGNTKQKLPKCLEEIQPSDELEGGSSSELFGSKNLGDRRMGRLVLEDRSTSDNSRLTKEDQAETPADLKNKLSGFMFKPRKTIPSVLNVAAGSEMKTRKRSSNDGLVSSLTNPRKRKQNTDVGSAERTSTSKTLFVSSFGEDNVLRRDTVGEKETGEGGLENQRIRILPDGVSKQVQLCSPPPSQRTSKSDQIRTNVSSSALAKLSRFSFTCRTEPKAVAPSSAGPRPPQLDNGKSWTVNQDGNQAKKFFTGDLNPNTDKARKIFTNINPSTNEAPKISRNMNPSTNKALKIPGNCQPVSKINQPVAGLTAEKKHGTEPATQPIRKQVDLNDDPDGTLRTVNLNKRKCFHLGPPLNGARSPGLFSGPSLLGSSEFSMDDLDTDWDQEISKTI